MQEGHADFRPHDELKKITSNMSDEPFHTRDPLLSSTTQHIISPSLPDNQSERRDTFDDVFVSNGCRANGTSDDELLQSSSIRKPPPVKAASTISRRSSNRPVLQRQKSLSFANPPVMEDELPCTNSTAVIEEQPSNNVEVNPEQRPQPSSPAKHTPKMPPHIRPKLSRDRTKTGNIVLPHKFRKSRRDKDRLDYIHVSSMEAQPRSKCLCCCGRNRRGSDEEADQHAKSSNWFRLPCRKKPNPDTENAQDIRAEELYLEEDPLRKRCLRAFLNGVYVLMVVIAAVVTYSMVQDLINSMDNPVRSIHFNKVEEYDAPGIAVYPGGANFKACGHYYNNVVTSKIRLGQLDLENLNCSYTDISYTDPHYPNITREALVVRGPTSFTKREAIFLHFELEDVTRHFFTVSYFVFPNWDRFNSSPTRADEIMEYHRYKPTFALSAGLRMWIKLIMSEATDMSGAKRTDFKVEYSVVKFRDRRPKEQQKKHLFFIFFEWKNDIIEESSLIYTTTPWSIGAGLCGVFLTLHRGCQIAQTSYKRVQKDKMKRSIRKRTLRELRQRSVSQTSQSQRSMSQSDREPNTK